MDERARSGMALSNIEKSLKKNESPFQIDKICNNCMEI
jgi:hypothetical protein